MLKFEDSNCSSWPGAEITFMLDVACCYLRGGCLAVTDTLKPGNTYCRHAHGGKCSSCLKEHKSENGSRKV